MKLLSVRTVCNLFLFLLFFSLFYNTVADTHIVYAQADTPQLENTNPVDTQDAIDPEISGKWVYDARVTEVGKSAERARQFVFWVFSHSPIYSSPILAQMWAISRNIAYLFVVFTIILLAIHMVLTRTKIGPTFSGISLGFDNSINIQSIITRVAMMLMFITFSYILILGMIQASSIMMSFFIEQVGGCDLFNIKFAGEGSKCVWPSDENYQSVVTGMESNYTEFVGYSFQDSASKNNEMINTSVFLIQLTTLTYNALAVIMLLRYIILWFMLILSPFLALLLPIVFIRNTGWIWIGEFFRWLLYGPLVALFIAAIARIWKAGIPFSFDFSRINTQEGQVYPTSISILYGGPAQTLSTTNSSNYVDTYVEYIISIIMLWAAIILPWFLLRIFRDYCCDILKENQATLKQILYKFKIGGPLPEPGPSKPASKTLSSLSMLLPFRKTTPQTARETKKQISSASEHRSLSALSTQELLGSIRLNMSNLTDIAKTETRKEERNRTEESLKRIQHPTRIEDPRVASNYLEIKKELRKRASKGDRQADKVVRAIEPGVVTQVDRKEVDTKNIVENVRKTIQTIDRQEHLGKSTTGNTIKTIARLSNTTENQTKSVIQSLQTKSLITKNEIKETARATDIPEQSVNKIATESIQRDLIYAPHTIQQAAQNAGISENKAKSVLARVAVSQMTPTDNERISQDTDVSSEAIEKVMEFSKNDQAPAESLPKTMMPIDEYESIKNMWIRHYRDSDVPMSGQINNRAAWLESEIPMLTNMLNQISSEDEKQRTLGLKHIFNSIPYLMLGGFDDEEIAIYIKAKLEAAKSAKSEVNASSSLKKEGEDVELDIIPTTPPKEALNKSNVKEKELPLPGFADEREVTS